MLIVGRDKTEGLRVGRESKRVGRESKRVFKTGGVRRVLNEGIKEAGSNNTKLALVLGWESSVSLWRNMRV